MAGTSPKRRNGRVRSSLVGAEAQRRLVRYTVANFFSALTKPSRILTRF
jgi:hypothetical protein